MYEYGWLFDADNEYVDSDKWSLVQADWFEKNDVHRFYYSDLPYIEDSDSDFVVPFDNTVPEAAFGKYVHVYCGGYLLSDTDNALWAYAPSKYHVTKWDSSKSYTVNDNGDDKSVTVFTIQNSKKSGKKINIQSSIKVNGKKYKITGIVHNCLKRFHRIEKARLHFCMYRPQKVRPKNLTIGGRYFYG